jgi:hypothetical protein
MEVNDTAQLYVQFIIFLTQLRKTMNPFSQRSHSSGIGKTKQNLQYNTIQEPILINIHSSMQSI